MVLGPSRVALFASVALALAFAWYVRERNWHALTADRLLYGIPWGTLVVVGVNVGFYLLAQGGLFHFDEPVIYPFVSWSYFYPLGMLTAGIAHSSPGHLLSNMTATLVFGTVAEYAWGHYPPSAWGHRLGGLGGRLDAVRADSVWTRPWMRALVVFPGVVLLGALVITLFSLGPGIGFSGVAFAIAGFAVVTTPLAAVVGVVANNVLQRLYSAVTQPTIRAGVEAGPPSPPGWASIGFHTHMLGFLLGVLVGIWLLYARGQRRPPERVFFGTVAFGLALSLWLVVWPADSDTFVLYQAVGVALVVGLSILIAVAVGGSDRALPRPLSVLPRAPTRRQIAIGYLLLVALAIAGVAAGAVVTDEVSVASAVGVGILLVLLAVPALPPLLPDRWLANPVSRRQTAVALLALATALVGIIGIPMGFVVVKDDSAVESENVTVQDYHIAYVDNATSGHSLPGDVDAEELRRNVSGVVVVSDQREVWTTAVRAESLAYHDNRTVTVGGVGWRETVEAQRRGWDVVGNDSAFMVDLVVDDDRTRSYTSKPVQAAVRIDGYTLSVVPREDDFALDVHRNGTDVGTVPLPAVNESATVGPLTVETEENDEVHVLVRTDGTRVRVATRKH